MSKRHNVRKLTARAADDQNLRRVIAILRGPGGCAWDRKQTPRSLAPSLVEESHEAQEAIERGQAKQACEELGDVLFVVLTQIAMAEQRGRFTYSDVVQTAAKKYIDRHPHVFKQPRALKPGQILENWETSKHRRSHGRSPVDSIPASLPALYQSKRIIDKLRRLGVSWRRPPLTASQKRRLGKTLFDWCVRAAKSGADPEAALRAYLRRVRRWSAGAVK